MKMETQQPKMYGVSKRYAKREVHSSTRLSQKTRETSNKQPNLTLKEKGQNKNPKVSRGKEKSEQK